MEFDSPADAGRLTDAQMEALAVQAYQQHLGKTVLVHEGEAVFWDGDGVEQHENPYVFDPPILCRVVATPAHDVVRWNDPDYIDPYWDAEILGDRRRGDHEIECVIVDGYTIGREEGVQVHDHWEVVADYVREEVEFVYY